MAARRPLSGGSLPVELLPGGYSLVAPGLVGTVTELTSQESATRSGGGVHEPALLAACRGAGVHVPAIFEIEVTAAGEAPAAGPTRGAGLLAVTRDGEPAIVLQVPRLGPGTESAVLYTDEAGVSRWLTPQGQAPASASAPGGTLVFHLPRVSPPRPGGGEATRGPISRLGRRLVRVLAWATDDIVGRGALAVAAGWEEAKHPYRILRLSPSGGTTEVDWQSLGQGRALLLIHGTFSSTVNAFGSLLPAARARLAELYDGRILAFDHPTIHVGPRDNAQTLLRLLPPQTRLEIDVVTHSRGGLVARELIERPADLEAAGRSLAVRRAVLVAAPNRGTILTDGDHAIEMLDRYTNLLTYLPDDAYTLSMEGLFMAGKLLLHGALKSLPGLRSMFPAGDYLREVNAGRAHATRYHAIGSSFTPANPGLLARFCTRLADRFVDAVFGEDNDGVVPTAGCYECAASLAGFPIPENRRRIYGVDDQVHHCNYFTSASVLNQVVDWLSAP